MGPAFVQDFVNVRAAATPTLGQEADTQASRDETGPQAEVPTLPVPQKPPKRPDYRAEKLLKNVPGNEKEMDRYVDRFFDKYNLWVYLSLSTVGVCTKDS